MLLQRLDLFHHFFCVATLILQGTDRCVRRHLVLDQFRYSRLAVRDCNISETRVFITQTSGIEKQSPQKHTPLGLQLHDCIIVSSFRRSFSSRQRRSQAIKLCLKALCFKPSGITLAFCLQQCTGGLLCFCESASLGLSLVLVQAIQLTLQTLDLALSRFGPATILISSRQRSFKIGNGHITLFQETTHSCQLVSVACLIVFELRDVLLQRLDLFHHFFCVATLILQGTDRCVRRHLVLDQFRYSRLAVRDCNISETRVFITQTSGIEKQSPQKHTPLGLQLHDCIIVSSFQRQNLRT